MTGLYPKKTIEQSFRHEYKYIISDMQIICLQQRLNAVMRLDPHAGDKGKYSISSLYFDDYYNQCLNENISGIDPREKYRIRIYNNNSKHIILETKRKERGMTQKTSHVISCELYEMLVSGGIPKEIQKQPLIVRKLVSEIQMRQMKPVVIVSYDRVPYVSKMGNVRITIDSNLNSSRNTAAFLNGQFSGRPVMPRGFNLLEIKWDQFIPDEIYHAAQLDNLTWTAYSKYALCRRFMI